MAMAAFHTRTILEKRNLIYGSCLGLTAVAEPVAPLSFLLRDIRWRCLQLLARPSAIPQQHNPGGHFQQGIVTLLTLRRSDQPRVTSLLPFPMSPRILSSHNRPLQHLFPQIFSQPKPVIEAPPVVRALSINRQRITSLPLHWRGRLISYLTGTHRI